jgi:sugar phosphate permease
MDAVRIPNVLSYAFAFGFFKLINYAMFFWLPYFLSLHFSPEKSNMISVLYDVGMMPGGIIVGTVSDMLGGRRACVIAAFMCILAPLLIVFAEFSSSLSAGVLLPMLGLMGILVGGPNNIITSAVSADLAEHPSLKGNTKALGTVTGIINGSGSITAALGLLLIGPIQVSYGWSAVWYFLVFCTVIGTFCMSSKVYKEIYFHNVNTEEVKPAANVQLANRSQDSKA